MGQETSWCSHLIPDKIDFKPKLTKRDRDHHYILLKGKIHQDIINLNIFALKTRAAKFIKETLLQLKSHIDPTHWQWECQYSILANRKVIWTKTNQRNAGSDWHHKPNWLSRYVHNILPKHKKTYSLLSSSENFLQNWPHAWTQRKTQKIQENWNGSLHPIWPAQITAGYQQQKQQKVLKLMETEELTSEWKMCEDRN